jgi:hypothetical protein
MKNEIIANLEDPKRLEALYHHDKTDFRRAFTLLYPDIQGNIAAQIWNERLNFGGQDSSLNVKKSLPIVLTLCLLAGLIAKIPDFTSINPEHFYPRNIAFIVFPALTAFFIWNQKHFNFSILIGYALAFLVPAIYINLLPGSENTDTFVLAVLHLPVLLWGISGYAFIGGNMKDYNRKIDYLRFNGDLIVMTGLMLLTGAVMTAITINLFSIIGVQIEEIYFQYVGIWGLSSAPIVATYLVQSNPGLVGKVSPVIARIFAPLVLFMLVVYLGTVLYTRKNPYTDRDFLLIFNGLLVGVMALILFSVIEISRKRTDTIEIIILFLLAAITVVVNGIALSAILFRIATWGVTPNRLAVMGSNLLMLTHLFIVAYHLFGTIKNSSGIELVKYGITVFLPFYLIWTMIIVFAFPILFGSE